MKRVDRDAVVRALTSDRGRDVLTVWVVVLMMSGSGFRYLLGLPLYVLVNVATLAAVVVGFRSVLLRHKVPILILAFIGLSAVSVIWSTTPAFTALAVSVLVVTTFVAAITVYSAGTFRFMRLLYRGLQVSLLGGLAFELFVTVFVRDTLMPLSGDLGELAGLDEADTTFMWSENLLLEGGPIQGFVGNRNPFAALALITAIVASVMLLDGRVRRLDGLLTIGASALVMALTRSATISAITFALLILVGGAYAIRRLDRQFSRLVTVGIAMVGFVVAALASRHWDTVLAMFDRDTNLTNRTDIWSHVIDLASSRPEGWGYVGTWPVWEEPYGWIGEQTTVRATHAHNAFLDAWLQVGIVGAVLLVIIVATLSVRVWRVVQHSQRGDSYIPLGWALITAALALQAFTESRLLIEGGWFLLVALWLMVPGGHAIAAAPPFFARTGLRREPDVSLWRKNPTISDAFVDPWAPRELAPEDQPGGHADNDEVA